MRREGVLAFYNLGHPQFYDDKARAPSFVHSLDLRQYYPTAKYFHEIGYRRIYEADLAAYLEETGKRFAQVAQRELRNLDTNLIEKVEARRPVVEGMRARFSPERWAAYVRDARFFRQTMNQENWFKTMLDLGGNATPVWMANAHLLFNAFEATDSNFARVSILIDPITHVLCDASGLWASRTRARRHLPRGSPEPWGGQAAIQRSVGAAHASTQGSWPSVGLASPSLCWSRQRSLHSSLRSKQRSAHPGGLASLLRWRQGTGSTLLPQGTGIVQSVKEPPI